MFCKKCGTELIDGVCPRCTQDESNSEDDYESKISQLFMSQNERFVAVLGKKHSEKYLEKGKCREGFAIISDKRLYSFGRSYDIGNNLFGKKRVRENKQSKTIDLKDITGTGEGSYRSMRWFMIGILYLILTIASLIAGITVATKQNGLTEEAYNTIIVIMIGIIPVLFFFMILYFIIYLVSKIHVLAVQYNGSEMGFDMAYFTSEEVNDFQRKLRIAKDKVIENNRNTEQTVSSMMQVTPHNGKADELVKMADLLSKGLISQEEFDKMKKELI